MSGVVQGVDYLSEPVEHLFVKAKLLGEPTPILTELLTDDIALRRTMGERWWWAKGPGSERNPNWQDQSGPEWRSVRKPCPACGRETATRRDGQPVRHKANGEWCTGTG